MANVQFLKHEGGDLSIKSIQTSKDKIQQPELAKHDNMYIPPLGSSMVISGKSGSGKSTLLSNLLTDGRFYGKTKDKPNGWFDKIFLFSPTANGDDIQKSLGIPKKFVFTELDEAPRLLEIVLDTQQKKIDKADGADKVEQYAVIFDDVIGDTKFMNSKAFTRCFYQVRHVNCTTFICTQHFKRVPKICRLQANFIFFFQGSQSEVETITEEFAPPKMNKKRFMKFVEDVTDEPFAFLTINMKVPTNIRFRKHLDSIADFANIQDEHGGAQQNFVSSKERIDDDHHGHETGEIEQQRKRKRSAVGTGTSKEVRTDGRGEREGQHPNVGHHSKPEAKGTVHQTRN